MENNPYKTPESKIEKEGERPKYISYKDVPIYRRQWFFWLTYFTVTPVAIGALLFGDIYYVKKGKVVSFGMANRIVAGFLAVVYIYNIAIQFTR